MKTWKASVRLFSITVLYENTEDTVRLDEKNQCIYRLIKLKQKAPRYFHQKTSQTFELSNTASTESSSPLQMSNQPFETSEINQTKCWTRTKGIQQNRFCGREEARVFNSSMWFMIACHSCLNSCRGITCFRTGL